MPKRPKISLLVPYAEDVKTTGDPCPMLSLKQGALRGATVAVLNNHWQSMAVIAGRIEERLTKEHGVARVVQRDGFLSAPAKPEVINELGGTAKAVIVGLGN